MLDSGYTENGRVQAYAARQRWDYFVKHLLGKKPPENYAVSPPDKN